MIPLLDKVSELYPEFVLVERKGYSHALKAVGRDSRTMNGFVWKLGTNIQFDDTNSKELCGIGLHLGKTWAGMSTGGHGVGTLLVVQYKDSDVYAEDDEKIRVSRCTALMCVDGWKLISRYGSEADLSEADLSGANLSWANLSGANLYGADLYGAYLYGANLSGANLYGAYLSKANLYGADLYGADLSEANLSRADLSGADLSRADLSGANLFMASLSGANLSGAIGYSGTR